MSRAEKVKRHHQPFESPAQEVRHYDIRCHHIDYERPSEEPGEFKWRCPAWFRFDADLPHWQRVHCPHHRHLYRPSDEIMPPAHVRQAQKVVDHTAERLAMPPSVSRAGAEDEGSRRSAEAEQRRLREASRA